MKIIIEIPDLIINDTIIKRKAEMFSLVYNQSAQFVSVGWEIKHYSNNDGEYGDYIGDKISDKIKEIIADNSVTVLSSTGEIIEDLEPYYDITYVDEVVDDYLFIDGVETIGQKTITREVKTLTIDVMGQYDWFNVIAENVDVNIHNMIRNYALQADWNLNLK